MCVSTYTFSTKVNFFLRHFTAAAMQREIRISSTSRPAVPPPMLPIVTALENPPLPSAVGTVVVEGREGGKEEGREERREGWKEGWREGEEVEEGKVCRS